VKLTPHAQHALSKLYKTGKAMSDVDALFRRKDRLDTLERTLNRESGERELSISQRRAVVDAQQRASEVFQTLSEGAPLPRPGEGPLAYRIRLAEQLKHHSREFRDVDVRRIALRTDSFPTIENQIYDHAKKRGLDPLYRGNVPKGQLRERKVTDEAGREWTAFHGDSTKIGWKH
jgi:hypothetical protein